MQNLNYNQQQTALILAGRTQLAQPLRGDLFAALYSRMDATTFNQMVDDYLAMEADIKALFTWNTEHSTSFVVNGRNEDNDVHPITDPPSTPFPIHK